MKCSINKFLRVYFQFCVSMLNKDNLYGLGGQGMSSALTEFLEQFKLVFVFLLTAITLFLLCTQFSFCFPYKYVML